MSDERKAFSRLSQATSDKKTDEGYTTPGKTDSDDTPRITGRGRLAAMTRPTEPQDAATSSSSSRGRGRLVSLVQTSSIDQSIDPSFSKSSEEAKLQGTIGSSERPGIGGRGKLLSMVQPNLEHDQPPKTAGRGSIGGRGKLMSMATPEQPGPAAIVDEAQSGISSTTDALAQLRLKRREEASSKSSGSKEATTFQQYVSLAAPLDEPAVEEVVEAKIGTKGAQLQGLTNYIRLQTEPNKGVFEYEARFDPPVHSNQLRYALMNQQLDVIGRTKTFDGVKLCLPIQLPDQVTQLQSANPNDNSDVTITLIYKGRKKFSECQQLYGILFKNIMKILKFVQFGLKNFDPSAPKVIPQHKLEIWPGYVTAVEECHDGVMLCVDVTHRVLRQTAVLDIFQHAYRNSRGEDFKTKVTQALLGAVVLTRYNNKTYRIDDIDWDQNPTNTFQTKTGEVSYVQYYKQQYNIEIRDLKQPLLISREEKRVAGKAEKESRVYSIIPEISFLTGLTDEQRADFKVMRDVATFTRISPNQRANELVQFCKRVNNCPETKQLLANWGLSLMDNAVAVTLRQMEEERVIFANGKTFGVGPNADFGKYCTNNEQMSVVNLHNWLLIHVKNDTKAAKSFMDCMEKNIRSMGITASKPKVIILDNDKTETYASTLRQALNVQTQIVVCLCPTARDDRYNTIKKICCAESPIPSQVINARTLGKEEKNRSIVQKIALQMNCKLGGSLWSIKIPLANCMIIGIDTHHDKKSGSVSAFVASTNDTYTNWYSKAVVQSKNEELVHGLVVSLQHALQYYKKVNNNQLPRKIIIFRDGVGDGQLRAVKDYELAQLKQACSTMSEDYNPPFTFVVVQKRINARFYVKKGAQAENPNPGAVLDHTITRRGLYDFYLVPQSVRQGTVTPTHCVALEDESNFPPDVLQRLTYKLCFLYYNWPGTVRVPACCQYAHKLAFLVGNSLKREPAEQLNNRLFYL
ncbi:protein argonaute-3-like [Contarinia nasturtii]|uniref:protein argonaute-3-like n=1 Tax=Contarinia nasturtii TaxID=265458 RepID=UPI0012D37B49|nr:protein argonaute-3-like [Contarinia nasturtii]